MHVNEIISIFFLWEFFLTFIRVNPFWRQFGHPAHKWIFDKKKRRRKFYPKASSSSSSSPSISVLPTTIHPPSSNHQHTPQTQFSFELYAYVLIINACFWLFWRVGVCVSPMCMSFTLSIKFSKAKTSGLGNRMSKQNVSMTRKSASNHNYYIYIYLYVVWQGYRY